MRLMAILGLLIVLAGCGTTEPFVRTVTHTVMVPVPCEPERPARPTGAVDALPIGASIDTHMRALRADRQRAKGYIGQLEAALTSCREPSGVGLKLPADK